MPKNSNRHSAATQTSFKGVGGWGGKRRGSGRKNLSRQVNHMKRVRVDFRKPLHLTLKIRDSKWNLRCGGIAVAFKKSSEGARKFGFRLLHYSILRDHLHLIVEAGDNESLGRGMRSFGARLGKAIRRIIGGRGPVFRGRYHLDVITNPTQMRNTLAYVLQNFAKHARLLEHVDAFSSARYFSDWKKLFGPGRGPVLQELEEESRQTGFKSPNSKLPPYLSPPRSWLAREGWMRAKARLQTASVG